MERITVYNNMNGTNWQSKSTSKCSTVKSNFDLYNRITRFSNKLAPKTIHRLLEEFVPHIFCQYESNNYYAV